VIKLLLIGRWKSDEQVRGIVVVLKVGREGMMQEALGEEPEQQAKYLSDNDPRKLTHEYNN